MKGKVFPLNLVLKHARSP